MRQACLGVHARRRCECERWCRGQRDGRAGRASVLARTELREDEVDGPPEARVVEGRRDDLPRALPSRPIRNKDEPIPEELVEDVLVLLGAVKVLHVQVELLSSVCVCVCVCVCVSV
jgi:hypothetical protein